MSLLKISQQKHAPPPAEQWPLATPQAHLDPLRRHTTITNHSSKQIKADAFKISTQTDKCNLLIWLLYLLTTDFIRREQSVVLLYPGGNEDNSMIIYLYPQQDCTQGLCSGSIKTFLQDHHLFCCLRQFCSSYYSQMGLLNN